MADCCILPAVPRVDTLRVAPRVVTVLLSQAMRLRQPPAAEERSSSRRTQRLAAGTAQGAAGSQSRSLSKAATRGNDRAGASASHRFQTRSASARSGPLLESDTTSHDVIWPDALATTKASLDPGVAAHLLFASSTTRHLLPLRVR